MSSASDEDGDERDDEEEAEEGEGERSEAQADGEGLGERAGGARSDAGGDAAMLTPPWPRAPGLERG